MRTKVWLNYLNDAHFCDLREENNQAKISTEDIETGLVRLFWTMIPAGRFEELMLRPVAIHFGIDPEELFTMFTQLEESLARRKGMHK